MAQAGVIIVSGLTTPTRWVECFIVEAYTDSGLTNRIAVATCLAQWDGTENQQIDAIVLDGLAAGQTYYIRAGVTAPITSLTTWFPAVAMTADAPTDTTGTGSGGSGGSFKWVVSLSRKPLGSPVCPVTTGQYLRHIDEANTVIDTVPIDFATNTTAYFATYNSTFTAANVYSVDLNTGTVAFIGTLTTAPGDVPELKVLNDPTFGKWLVAVYGADLEVMAINAFAVGGVTPPQGTTMTITLAGGGFINSGHAYPWDIDAAGAIWVLTGLSGVNKNLNKVTLYAPTSTTVGLHFTSTDLNATYGYTNGYGVLADKVDNTLIIAAAYTTTSGSIFAKYNPATTTIVTTRDLGGINTGNNIAPDENWMYYGTKYSAHDLSTVSTVSLSSYTSATVYGGGAWYDSVNNVLWSPLAGSSGVGHQLGRFDLANATTSGLTIVQDTASSANVNGPNLICYGDSVSLSTNGQFVIGNHKHFFDIVNTLASGTGPAGEILFHAPVDDYLTLPANLPMASAWCLVPPTNSATFQIRRDGLTVGTINFAAGAQYATFTFPNDVLWSPGAPGTRQGQILELDAPTPQDPTLCGYGHMITGTVGIPNGVGTQPPPPPPPTGKYGDNAAAACTWMATQQLSDGAIQYSSTKINPYFANLAALGWLECPSSAPLVKAWIQWYIAHLNATDIWSTGTGGTMYDYNISGGVTGSSLNTADSTDSYAATFLSVVYKYYNTTGADTTYISSIQTQLDNIGKAVLFTQQSDGLTWALPTFHIKYLEDNCEVYRGLSDLASLFTTLSNPRAATYSAAASACHTGVMTLYLSGSSAWSPHKDSAGSTPAPSGSVWYPDSVTQLFPVINGVVTPSATEAVNGYNFLTTNWPNWPLLPWNNPPTSDPFPWVLVGYGASLMSDFTNVNSYISNINSTYLPNFQWPFYCAEGGWYIRMNDQMASSSGSAGGSGSTDMLTVVQMDANMRKTQYLHGPNDIFTVVDTTNKPSGYDGMTWFIKGPSGYPWDGKPFDGNYAVYIWITENVWTDPHTFKNFHFPVPMVPRYYTPGSGETSVTISDTHFDIRSACGTFTTSQLGIKIRTTFSGPHNDINFGGDIGQRPYYVGSYYYDYNTSTGQFTDLEQFYFCGADSGNPALGWVMWHHIKNGVIVNSSSFNQIRTGSTSLVFPCGLPAIP